MSSLVSTRWVLRSARNSDETDVGSTHGAKLLCNLSQNHRGNVDRKFTKGSAKWPREDPYIFGSVWVQNINKSPANSKNISGKRWNRTKQKRRHTSRHSHRLAYMKPDSTGEITLKGSEMQIRIDRRRAKIRFILQFSAYQPKILRRNSNITYLFCHCDARRLVGPRYIAPITAKNAMHRRTARCRLAFTMI